MSATQNASSTQHQRNANLEEYDLLVLGGGTGGTNGAHGRGRLGILNKNNAPAF